MSTFTRRPAAIDNSFTVGVIMNKSGTKGHVGLEIECEGNKLPIPNGAHGAHSPVNIFGLPKWAYVHDGSLRGKANAEYVLRKPISFDDVPTAVNDLYKHLACLS